MPRTITSHDQVTIYLAIESAFVAPSVLIQKLGVLPDKQWLAGEARGMTGKVWERHGWIMEVRIGSDEYRPLTASQLLPMAIETFGERLAPLIQRLAQLDISAEKYIVVSIVCNFAPGIELGLSFLKLLSAVGGSVQIDIQCECLSTRGCSRPSSGSQGPNTLSHVANDSFYFDG